MAKPQDMSLYQLEVLLQDRIRQIDKLKKKQHALQRDLDDVTTEIESIEGKQGTRNQPTKGRKKTVRRKRAKNKKPLKEYVMDVLQKNDKGLTLGEVHDQVIAAGYKSRSKNFKNVLYQCLYQGDEFAHVGEAGVYTLKQPTKQQATNKAPHARKK